MYELYDVCTIMVCLAKGQKSIQLSMQANFTQMFHRNKHMMCDFGTGNNNKINWVIEEKQELIDIFETVYKGARKGRGLVISPKDYSTRHRY